MTPFAPGNLFCKFLASASCIALFIFANGCDGGGGSRSQSASVGQTSGSAPDNSNNSTVPPTVPGSDPPSSPAPDPPSTPATPPAAPVTLPPLPGMVLGVGTHIYQQDVETNILLVKEMGLASVRDDFIWAGVERTKGVLAVPDTLQRYNTRLAQSGLAPLMILDYGNDLYRIRKPVATEEIQAFVNYARFSAAAMVDKVAFFEIWNEWNNKTLPNSPESYLELVKATAPAVKTANSKALVLAGSSNVFDEWLTTFVRLGALRYVDGISVHPYTQCQPDMRPEILVFALDQYALKLTEANGGNEVPLYVTEIGWPTNTGACGSTPAQMARYVARALLLIRTVPSVRGVWWYGLKDDGQDLLNMENNFGLVGYDYQPKPAFAVMAAVAPIVQGPKRFTRLPSELGLVVVQIEEQSGDRTYALWTANGRNAEVAVTLEQKPQSKVYNLRLGTERPIEVPLPSQKSRIVVVVDDMPQLIFGAAGLTQGSVTWK